MQGTEAVYLAKKAGIRSLLIDKNPLAPASEVCDEMGVFDVLKQGEQFIAFLKKADFILPAIENDEVHASLLEISEKHGFKLAFDIKAYALTSSKLKSDELMRRHGIPAPNYFPDCKGPYMLKPSGGSGSADVFPAENAEEVRQFLSEHDKHGDWIVQEYLTGPSYSIEIIGTPGMYRTYEITEIHMDDGYDCKMVTAPCDIPESLKKGLSETAVKLAGLIGLSGVMDVEVIDHEGDLKVLEIDARIPSQTPMAVYHSSGVNLLSELADVTIKGKFTSEIPKRRRYAAIEHYLINETGVHPKGEHIMGEGRPLLYMENFFGADEALTDYDGGRVPWRGTFINSGETAEELAEKRLVMFRMLSGKSFS